MAIYENPSNGYQEEITWRSSLAVFLFGPVYLGVKGAWGAFVLYIIAFSGLFALGGFPAAIVVLVYPFMTGGIFRKHYLRKGWREITPSKGKK